MALKQGTKLKMTHTCVVKWWWKGSDYCSLKWKSEPWKLETLKSHLQTHLDDSQNSQAYLSVPVSWSHPMHWTHFSWLHMCSVQISGRHPWFLHFPYTYPSDHKVPYFPASTMYPTSVPLSSSCYSSPHLDIYIYNHFSCFYSCFCGSILHTVRSDFRDLGRVLKQAS